MRFDRLSRGQRIAAASSVLLFIFMWLPWFGTKEKKTETGLVLPARNVTIDAWQSFQLIDLILLLAVVGTIVAVVQSIRRNDRNLRAAASLAVAGAGGLVTLLVLYRVFTPLTSTSHRFGIYLGLLAALGLLAGGLMWAEEEGGAVTDARDRMAKAVSTAREKTGPKD